MEEKFYNQLGKSVQAWLWVESSLYSLYYVIMGKANGHLISVTFHHIESFNSKVILVDRCLKLLFDKNSENYKKGKKTLNKALKLNETRNKIVHQPISILMQGNQVKEICIKPSYNNALALVKDFTTHAGPVIRKEYSPSKAKLKDKYKIDYFQLYKIEQSFKSFSHEISEYTKSIDPLIKKIYKDLE